MPPSRPLLVLLLSGVACLLVAPFALREDAPTPQPDPPARATPAPDPVDPVDPVAVLRGWDRSRAAVWRRGDPDALAALYTAGSRAGRADRALLAAYSRRGLRVTGMRMQVADVVVERAGPHRIELVVTDRLVGATAVGGGARVGLPRDRWSRRRVVLLRVGEDWRVAQVHDQVSMAESTASTSGSANS